MSDEVVCPKCGVLNENHKDYGNPTVRLIYAALSIADLADPRNDIVNWLNRNGFANLTCCPECHVDDFTHVEGCRLAEKVPYVPDLAEVLNRLREGKDLKEKKPQVSFPSGSSQKGQS